MRCVYDTPDTLESGINNESNEVNDDSNENDNYEDSGNDSNESDDYEDSGNNNNNNSNNNNDDDDDIEINESDSVGGSVIEQHLARVLETHKSINDVLDKYRSKICQQGSVHRKKRPNNTIETGTPVFIAP